MAITINSVGNNPQQPSIREETYIPDQLIAGNLQLVTDSGSIASGILKRGTILGQVTADGSYKLSVATATDGSENPSAILADDVDATLNPVNAGLYLMGEFNSSAITFDTTWTVGKLKPALRPLSIFLKNVVSAADPT